MCVLFIPLPIFPISHSFLLSRGEWIRGGKRRRGGRRSVVTTADYVVLLLSVTTDVQNPRVRYVGTNLNLSLTCDFAEKSTAEGCLFNFTGINTEPQSFLVNRVGDSPMASACTMANAVANNMNYMWSAFDAIRGVPITVELIAVDNQDNFECLPMRPGIGMHSLSKPLGL